MTSAAYLIIVRVNAAVAAKVIARHVVLVELHRHLLLGLRAAVCACVWWSW